MALDQDTIVRTLLADRAQLFAFIWSIVRDLHVAEDVFQEVSLIALSKGDQLKSAEALPVWFRTTARYRSLKALETLKRQPSPLDDQMLQILEPHWQAADQLETSDTAEALHQCLGELTDNNRRIVRMRYAEGLRGTEVAQKLGRKVETVYKSLSRIHTSLADCVRRRIGDSAPARPMREESDG